MSLQKGFKARILEEKGGKEIRRTEVQLVCFLRFFVRSDFLSVKQIIV